MKHLFLLIITACIIAHVSIAQGCVAIRSNGGVCTMMPHHVNEEHPSFKNWTFASNNRYFKSFRHFVGTEEQKQRVEEGSEVINHVFSTELTVTKQFSNRWSSSFFMPLVSNARSSLYEHDRKNRRFTHSFGLGDIRFAAYYWLFEPAKPSKINLQLGLGIKLPTGDYRYQDYFYKNDTTKVLGPVDQSIQLGDGGTGVTIEANTYYTAAKNLNFYFNGFYLLNPREQNGVSTARGSVPSASSIAYGSDVMSVPDQFMLRAGGSIVVNKFTFSAGGRIEGLPAKDLVGGSNGFRRPGYVVSVEPVLAYNSGKSQFYFSVPYAVQRNRTQSVPDKIRTQKTGVYAKGDAAFADYTMNFGVSVLLR